MNPNRSHSPLGIKVEVLPPSALGNRTSVGVGVYVEPDSQPTLATYVVGTVMAQLSLLEFEQTFDVPNAGLLYAGCPSPVEFARRHFSSRVYWS